MTMLLIPSDLAQAVANYLVARGLYGEVAGFLKQLEQLQPAPMTEQERRLKDFEALASCIRSGQVPQETVPAIMEGNAEFATWYAAKYPRDKE